MKGQNSKFKTRRRRRSSKERRKPKEEGEGQKKRKKKQQEVKRGRRRVSVLAIKPRRTRAGAAPLDPACTSPPAMDLAEKLSLLGLSEQKVKETLKNEPLTAVLAKIADQVRPAHLDLINSRSHCSQSGFMLLLTSLVYDYVIRGTLAFASVTGYMVEGLPLSWCCIMPGGMCTATTWYPASSNDLENCFPRLQVSQSNEVNGTTRMIA